MRIPCDIAIHNYKHFVHKSRASHSTLTIGSYPGRASSPDDIYLQICNIKNPKGDIYKVYKNIETVFMKFVSEGKFTIRLKDPAVDISVKCDAALALKFLKILKCVVSNKLPDGLSLSSLRPLKKRSLEKVITRLEITKKEELPHRDFPTSLQYLTVKGLQLSRIDLRILNLKRLVVLNLQANAIEELPLEFSTLSSLLHLDLCNNKIHSLPPLLFENSPYINLQHLDLGENKISFIPKQIDKMRNLQILSLHKNTISNLPFSIGRMKSLRKLNLSANILEALPVTLINLRLEFLDISGNPLNAALGNCIKIHQSSPSLKKIAAEACIMHRLNFEYPIIPSTLIEYLQYHIVCSNCDKPLYISYIFLRAPMSLHPASLVSDVDIVPTDKYCCFRCHR